MAFYNRKEQLYLETYAIGKGLQASLLRVRDRIKFIRNEPPNNATLWPIPFADKSLTNAEPHYSNIKREDQRHTAWPREIASLSFCPQSQCDP